MPEHTVVGVSPASPENELPIGTAYIRGSATRALNRESMPKSEELAADITLFQGFIELLHGDIEQRIDGCLSHPTSLAAVQALAEADRRVQAHAGTSLVERAEHLRQLVLQTRVLCSHYEQLTT